MERTFTSARHRHFFSLRHDPSGFVLVKLRDGVELERSGFDRERHAALSAQGVRVCGRPPVGDDSFVEEVAAGPPSGLGWVEELRRRGATGFGWDAFRRYFHDLSERDAAALLWCGVGRLWRWGGEEWLVEQQKI